MHLLITLSLSLSLCLSVAKTYKVLNSLLPNAVLRGRMMPVVAGGLVDTSLAPLDLPPFGLLGLLWSYS